MKIVVKKLRAALIVAAAVLGFGSQMSAETLTATFDNGLPDGWAIIGALNNNSDRARSGKGIWTSAKSDKTNYLVTTDIEGDIELYGRTYNTKSYGYITLFKVNDDNSLGEQIVEFRTDNVSSGQISFKKYSYTLDTPGRVAIALNYACIDDMTYTTAEVADGAILSISGLKSGDTFDFGGEPVSAGTEAVFTLLNSGSADMTITSIDVTGGYTITDGADLSVLAPRQSATVKVATPATDANGVLTIESDAVNTPYTVNLTSLWKQPVPVMNIDTEVVDFGKVDATLSRVVTIANDGDATLTARLATDDAMFTVEPANIAVEPGDEATVTVTFNYDAEQYGAHAATLTVTPNAGETVNVSLLARIADPNAWFEDFSGAGLPAGWETTGNAWIVADGVAKAAYSYSERNSTLITPTLEVVAGDELTFNYRATANYVTITVKAAKDGGDFKDIAKISADKMSEFEPYTIKGLAAGKYRFSFAADDYELDDFDGFRLDNNAPKLDVSPATTADFGKVYGRPEVFTYTVANVGTGSMNVEIESDNSCFVVSPSILTDIVSGEPRTFTVSFEYDGNDLGEKNGTITVTPTYNAAEAVSIAAHVVACDPNVWEEDFEDGEVPADWEAGNGWSVSVPTMSGNNGTKMVWLRQPSKSSLITPRLYATEGQKLEFYIGMPYDDEPLTIEYSADKNGWLPIDDSVTDGYIESGEITFKAPADGYYYIRFTGTYVMLDNFVGFQPAPSTLIVTSSEIPSTGYQYAPYTATVTVTETGAAAKVVSARLYVDGVEVAAAQACEVAVDESVTFALTYVPAEAVSGGQVQIELTIGDAVMFLDAVRLNITEATVVGDDGADSFLPGTLPSLVIRYAAVKGWNTIVLPFAPTDELFERIFGASFEVFELSGVDADGTILFETPGIYAAGRPYVVYAPTIATEGDVTAMAAGAGDIILNDVEIEAPLAGKTEKDGVSLNGYYAAAVPDDFDNAYVLNSGTTDLRKAAASDFDKAFRCYVSLPTLTGEIPPIRLGDYTITGIDAVVGDAANGETVIYDLGGRRVDGVPGPGLYIVNGKKMYLK
ncbi:MAG: choice-of-anchor D domain-containing protein [Muribaculaceae bacterium]|nr:choice-of-anchor D domain-containing protein [Muribaculaceae bacterium]